MENLKLTRLCHKLNYEFKAQELLTQALSHRSFSTANNERLEFLGDAILDFTITDALFKKFPKKNEGELSRLRAHLVCGESLAKIATEIDLGDSLLLGPGELKSGGFRRASILADALEAVFAAIYLDSDYLTCSKTILHLYEKRLNDDSLTSSVLDPKTALQEILQSKKKALPQYHLTKVEGKNHDQVFHITCEINDPHKKTTAKSSSRRKAEQKAAKKMLEKLE